MGERDEHGVTLRAHLLQVEKSSGEKLPELVNPHEFPHELAHVWWWFVELSNARPSGFASLEPISFTEIEAWARLTFNFPSPSEVMLIRRLDDLFRSVIGKKKATKK